MKEFIEKLIGRLEEKSKKWLDIWDKDRCDLYADGMNDAFDESIDIVNQLAGEYNNDYVLVHTQGLDVGIQCAMCTNPMKSDRGCDGGCSVDKEKYKKVLDVIKRHSHIAPYQPKGE